MSAVRYGAYGAEWWHWSAELGLTADLLPVVSNPHAIISATSTLRSLGKTPSRYNQNREVGGIKDWTTFTSQLSHIDSWARNPDYGICLQTRSVRALDVDIDDPALAGRIHRTAFEHLGKLPVRRRPGSSRLLMIFRLPGPFAKRAHALAPGALVELLGDGQQCVIAGTHPSGGRYTWDGGCPGEIPEVTLEQVDAFWHAIGADAPGGPDLLRSTGEPRGSLPDPGSDETARWLVAQGWVQGEGREGELWVRCPWEAEHTGDSGRSQTAYFPAGTGGYAQGHFHCLHAHCAGRTDADFLDAIDFRASFEADFAEEADTIGAQETRHSSAAPLDRDSSSDAPGPVGDAAAQVVKANGALPAAWARLKRDRKGFRPTVDNVVRALSTPGWGLKLGYDTFRRETVAAEWSEREGEEAWRPIGHRDSILLRQKLDQYGFLPVGRELLADALHVVAHAREFNLGAEWLERLSWDRRERIETFYTAYAGTPEGAYTRAVGLYTWTALAGRLGFPGTKADMVPVWVGGQGVNKTWSAEALAPFEGAHVTLDLTHRDENLARRMSGRCVWEISELRGLQTRDADSIKDFISERADTWIPKYQELAVRVPRQGLFIGTTNNRQFLADPTGNRRWLPIEIPRFDRAAVLRDRDQLWAEGYHRFMLEGVAWEAAERLAREVHGDYEIRDEILETEVSEWLAKQDPALRASGVVLRDVALGCGFDPRHINRAVENRLGAVLKNMGWDNSTRPRSEDGTRKRVWKIIN